MGCNVVRAWYLHAYLVPALWILMQSLAWIITAETLTWIQTLGPMIPHWDNFLLGSIFLIMDIDLDSLDERLYPMLLKNPQQYRNGQGSGYSKKVTFDDQVLILGEAAQRGVTPTDVPYNTRISVDYRRIDPSSFLSESPTSLSFWPCGSQERLVVDTSVAQRETGYFVPSESPSSSRSSSCRSSICSTSSDSSDRESTHHRSRFTALFHQQKAARSQTSEMTNLPTDKKSHRRGKNLVRRIMHPHQHKREVELQQQQQQHHHVVTPELVSPWSVNLSDTEYQPDAHHRKSFFERLGLKKRRSL
ncbi:MAG: hypothetical protein J3Q66DRAFT_358925 [Benniella sp.]|nr:MAG: hypothetical protein J3Q66DRAFT_358925 [Benniella sp.]